MKSLVFCSMAAVAACRVFAQAPQSITIEQAVQEALQNNPGLLAEKLGIPVAETAAITARLRPNPVVSVSSDHLDWLGTGYSAVNGAGPTESALRIDVPWERGHKREYRVDTAGYAQKIAQARVADSIRRLRLDVTLACIDVMEAKARLELAQDNLKSLQGVVQLNETRLQGGAIPPIELTRSRVAMLQFRSNVKTAELALTTARVRLQTLLGRGPSQTPIGSIDVSDPLKIPIPPSAPALDQIQTRALAVRPDIQAARLDQARSQSELRLQLANGKVDYTAGAEYRRQQGINGTGNSVGFFVSVPLPVFNRNQGEIARVTSEEVQLQKQIEALQSQVSGEVTGAYREYETARQLIGDIESDLLGLSQEARNTTTYVYQAGAGSLLDVLDAQRAFNETMSTYYDAQADYRRAVSRLTSVVGEEVIP
ncbi:MAG: TolC family protein [Acidobacteriia bacterium]|nr:TolC family protein [Terriglobia bacterium]